MRSSNPVLTRLEESARTSQRADYELGEYTVHKPYSPVEHVGVAVTLDAVVVRTVMLLAVTGIAGAASWLLLPDGAAITSLAMVGSMIAGLVLCLVISFGRITNPVPIVAYAALQGVLLGVVSRVFESYYSGIVLQAVVGTFGVFAAMAVLYRMRVLRATPKFTRFVIGALFGVVLLSFVNLVAYMFKTDLGLVKYGMTGKVGWVPILFSLFVVAIGALTFILDFEMIEYGVRAGLPERFAWYCAFGLLVGLIFVYWEMLRLLGYMRR